MSKIKSVKAFELFDSRGNPTVAVRVSLESGKEGFSLVPSGASTGKYESFELRDGGERLFGKGVKTAVNNLNTKIFAAIKGMDATRQREIDKTMISLDATENKSSLGANAILAASIAVAKAAAAYKEIPLYRYLAKGGAISMPLPMMNILNGGAHADNNIDIQEFMIRPHNTSSFAESMEICTSIYHTLKGKIKKLGLSTAVGDEGGFAPNLSSDEKALELLCDSIISAGYSTDKVKICLDAAASEWATEEGIYRLPKRDIKMDFCELISMWESLARSYPIVSIEDGLSEEDFDGTKELTERMGDICQIVGDDLFVTNKSRLQKGIDEGVANAILIKPNQIGTLTETLDVISLAKTNGYKVIVSHRSGDTEDTFLADLAVGVNAGQIKTGAPCRSERVSKYNRLLLIEEEI